MAWESLFNSARLIENSGPAPGFSWGEARTAIERAGPAIYWYPGSGNDLTPLVLDVPGNRTGGRLFPLAGSGQRRPLILWMSDYAPAYRNFPADHRGPADWNGEVWDRLGARVEVIGQPIKLVVPSFEAPNACINLAIFRARVTNDAVAWHRRPADGDEYTVIFSHAESEWLVRSVFAPDRLAIAVVALIRQGGFSCQRPFYGHEGGFQQYTDLPRLLASCSESVGDVAAYIVDRDDWQLDGYRESDARLADGGRMAPGFSFATVVNRHFDC